MAKQTESTEKKEKERTLEEAFLRLDEIIQKLEEYGVERCCYGHLHGPTHKRAIEGKMGAVDYSLVSADYLGFVPKKILN